MRHVFVHSSFTCLTHHSASWDPSLSYLLIYWAQALLGLRGEQRYVPTGPNGPAPDTGLQDTISSSQPPISNYQISFVLISESRPVDAEASISGF